MVPRNSLSGTTPTEIASSSRHAMPGVEMDASRSCFRKAEVATVGGGARAACGAAWWVSWRVIGKESCRVEIPRAHLRVSESIMLALKERMNRDAVGEPAAETRSWGQAWQNLAVDHAEMRWPIIVPSLDPFLTSRPLLLLDKTDEPSGWGWRRTQSDKERGLGVTGGQGLACDVFYTKKKEDTGPP